VSRQFSAIDGNDAGLREALFEELQRSIICFLPVDGAKSEIRCVSLPFAGDDPGSVGLSAGFYKAATRLRRQPRCAVTVAANIRGSAALRHRLVGGVRVIGSVASIAMSFGNVMDHLGFRAWFTLV
jgi:hypothetical protein